MKIRYIATSDLKPHPDAELVPPMRPGEWKDFVQDVAMRGIKVPLEVAGDGTILDGHHRHKAAKELAIPQLPVIDAILGQDTSTAYMLKAAVLRRHLTDDQRAVMAAMWSDNHKKEPELGPRSGLGLFTPSATRYAEGVVDSNLTRQEATELFKVSRSKHDRAKYVNNRSPGLSQRVHKGEIALNNAYRQVKGEEEKERIANTKPPKGTFQVIVIDPPWPYTNRQNDPSHQGTCPYETMPIGKISELAIPAAPNCILWLWTTNSFLHEAFHILEVWGFTYHTTLTWVKNFVGLGDWLGGQTEHCLLATKGSYHILRKNESTVLDSRRTKHSEKPAAFYEMVERLCPGEKIDMFARHQRDGWVCWGAESDELKPTVD